MKLKSRILVTAFSIGLASWSYGQIIIDDVYTSTYVPGTYVNDSTVTDAVTSFSIPLSDLTTAGFAASGSDKLVLSISTKWASNSGGAATAITYNTTQGFTQAVVQTGTRTQSEIWYLDNVTSDGDIDITFDAVTEGFAIRLFALGGTAAGVTDSNAKAQTNDGVLPTLTSPTNAFVLWEASIHRATTNIDNGYTESDFTWGGRGGSSAFYGIEGTGGTYNATVTNTRTDGSFVGATFAAVPEPSAFALLAGMFGLTWVMLRRRES